MLKKTAPEVRCSFHMFILYCGDKPRTDTTLIESTSFLAAVRTTLRYAATRLFSNPHLDHGRLFIKGNASGKFGPLHRKTRLKMADITRA